MRRMARQCDNTINFFKETYYIINSLSSDPAFSLANIWYLEYTFVLESISKFVKQRNHLVTLGSYSTAVLCEIMCKVNGVEDVEWQDFLPILSEEKQAAADRGHMVNKMLHEHYDQLPDCVKEALIKKYDKYITEEPPEQ